MMRPLALPALSLACLGCVGTAGGELLEFDAHAAGPPDAVAGEPYRFTTGRGFEVELSRASLRIGAVYMNQAATTSVSSDTTCTLAGIYVAQVTAGLDVDVLSGAPQPFPVRGSATSDPAKTGEVWLTGGGIDEPNDPTVILDVAGVATGEGGTYPFEAALTIGQNRAVKPPSPALPGAKPICKQRVVSPIPVDVTPREGGSLIVRVDPRGWFGNVDFTRLARVSHDPPLYRFADSSDDQPSRNLYDGIHASVGVYTFTWAAGDP